MTARAPNPPLHRSPRTLRLVDLLAGLSLVADLGMGNEPEEALRTCVAATLLARRIGLDGEQTRDVFYTALLQHVGCTAYAHETAAVFGDDILLNHVASRTNLARPSEVLRTFVPSLSGGRGRVGRLRLLVTLFTAGSEGRFGRPNNRAVCEVARVTARRLGLGAGVQTALDHALEAWNGSGGPAGLRGEAITLPARLVRVANIGTVFHRMGGTDAAILMVRDRSGGYLDPQLASAFCDAGGDILDEMAAADLRVVVAELEPKPEVSVAEGDVARVARVFGELIDLKSPYLHGHSGGVAARVREAGPRMGLDAAQLRSLELAAHLHDLGRAAVPTTTWEKPGPLTAAEWEQIRLHAYHTERVLSGSPALAPLATLAGTHHERLDRSGYHRACSGTELSSPARLLGAADAFQAMIAERPHRPAMSVERAAAVLQDEARAGRLDPDASGAVLAAADTPLSRPRRAWPDGLTDREIDVLRHLAGGASNRELGRQLGVSPRTAEHHVQSIYAKIGSSSRAAAALYAMEHDLLPPADR